MKTKITIALICVMMLIPGCTQTIIDQTEYGARLKINTFLMTSGLESLYYDPDGIFEVGKYKGIPVDLRLKLNPLTGHYEIVTETND
jgi:hypothetical protein